ncbi:MAG TPA: orotidine-5'-phosphate decarboxylase [Syntrophorhabdales bacterium]|nr:orotidine-5'-phosphate decarboxylase [Syntrophorhabdales bacterium]
MDAKGRMILALDVEDFHEAQGIVDEFKDHVGMFKVGKQLFTRCGPAIVEFIKSRHAGVFLDLKYHDIPNTVSKAGVEAARLHVDMFNVHAAGGFTMMEQTVKAVSEAAAKLALDRPKIIAVTVLTSIDDEELKRMGIAMSAKELTRRLALLTKEAGLDGVVAAGAEIELIRELCGDDFLIVTPGVRISDRKDDQKRTISPGEAISRGATYVVLGRTVLSTEQPKAALRLVEEQIGDALSRQ